MPLSESPCFPDVTGQTFDNKDNTSVEFWKGYTQSNVSFVIIFKLIIYLDW